MLANWPANLFYTIMIVRMFQIQPLREMIFQAVGNSIPAILPSDQVQVIVRPFLKLLLSLVIAGTGYYIAGVAEVECICLQYASVEFVVMSTDERPAGHCLQQAWISAAH